MREAGVEANHVTYSALIQACARGHVDAAGGADADAAWNAYDDMLAQGVAPSATLLGHLTMASAQARDATSNAPDVERALQAFRLLCGQAESEARSSSGLRAAPATTALSHVLTALADAHTPMSAPERWRVGEECVGAALDAGILPNVSTLKAVAQLGQAAEVGGDGVVPQLLRVVQARTWPEQMVPRVVEAVAAYHGQEVGEIVRAAASQVKA